MGALLNIVDVLVVVLVVFSVWRAVSTGPTQSMALSALLALALAIFGLVSISAAAGLPEKSSFSEGALFVFLIAIAAAAVVSLKEKPAR